MHCGITHTGLLQQNASTVTRRLNAETSQVTRQLRVNNL